MSLLLSFSLPDSSSREKHSCLRVAQSMTKLFVCSLGVRNFLVVVLSFFHPDSRLLASDAEQEAEEKHPHVEQEGGKNVLDGGQRKTKRYQR